MWRITKPVSEVSMLTLVMSGWLSSTQTAAAVTQEEPLQLSTEIPSINPPEPPQMFTARVRRSLKTARFTMGVDPAPMESPKP